MDDEAQATIDKIRALLDEEGLEVSRDDIRIKRFGGSWTVDLRLIFKPKHQTEEG